MTTRVASVQSFLRVALLSTLVGCSGESNVRAPVAQVTCGWTDSVRLTPQGIGHLRLGTSTAELLRSCAVVRDTTELTEGQAQRVVHLRVGPAVAYAEIAGDSVWRIGTRDSLLRTSDGLGVGTPVRTLLASDPEWAAHGEGVVAVGLRGHCGLSFLLAPMSTAPGQPLFVGGIQDLQKAPPDTPVVEILIVGGAHCEQRATG